MSSESRNALTHRHIRIGWGSLLLFLSLGIALETLHGFKLGYYLDVENSTRRHMWTLAHAHGTLLSLVHLGFAASLATLFRAETERLLGWAGAMLSAATVLLPAGFFLGGLFIYAGDPGLGIAAVPPGALLLFCAVAATAWTSRRSG